MNLSLSQSLVLKIFFPNEKEYLRKVLDEKETVQNVLNHDGRILLEPKREDVEQGIWQTADEMQNWVNWYCKEKWGVENVGWAIPIHADSQFRAYPYDLVEEKIQEINEKCPPPKPIDEQWQDFDCDNNTRWYRLILESCVPSICVCSLRGSFKYEDGKVASHQFGLIPCQDGKFYEINHWDSMVYFSVYSAFL